MVIDIGLREHEKCEALLAPQEVFALRQLPSGRVTLYPGSEAGRYIIEAGSYVGVVALPGGRKLVIEPKFPIETIFALLAEVYDPDKEWFADDLHSYATVDALFELVVRIFMSHVEDLIARGVIRGYQVLTDELVMVRGRILFPQTLRHHAAVRDQHWCSHSHFTPDVCENRILRWTMLYLQPYPYRESSLASRLHRASLALVDVDVDPEARELFERLVYHRLNEAYRPALDLARLLLDHVAFSGAVGEEPFLAYLVDMNWLFERYVGAVLKKAAKAWGVTVAEQETHWLDVVRGLPIRPDMVLYRCGDALLVVDAKYKPGRSAADLYEVLAYCHAVDLDQAVLVHPESDDAPAGVVNVRGAGSVKVHYLSLDLRGGLEQLEEQARAFAEGIGELLAEGVERW